MEGKVLTYQNVQIKTGQTRVVECGQVVQIFSVCHNQGWYRLLEHVVSVVYMLGQEYTQIQEKRKKKNKK